MCCNAAMGIWFYDGDSCPDFDLDDSLMIQYGHLYDTANPSQV